MSTGVIKNKCCSNSSGSLKRTVAGQAGGVVEVKTLIIRSHDGACAEVILFK